MNNEKETAANMNYIKNKLKDKKWFLSETNNYKRLQ